MRKQIVEITIQLACNYVTDDWDFSMLAPTTIVRVVQAESDNRIMQMVDAEAKTHRY